MLTCNVYARHKLVEELERMWRPLGTLLIIMKLWYVVSAQALLLSSTIISSALSAAPGLLSVYRCMRLQVGVFLGRKGRSLDPV